MYYDLTVTQFSKMLNNLATILDKAVSHADAKKFDAEVLLNSRLAPDQFNFIRQVQIACDSANLGVSRLTGKEAPKHDDSEKTIGDLKKRIDETVAFLKTVSEKDFDGAAERKISQPRWEGKWLSGHEFMVQHAIPNVYFHVTTAYSILRHNGVEVGKKDYLGAMPYKN
jgi:uncharacterized protein